MAYEVKGVVARSKGAPVTVETVIVPDPGPGEAVGDIQARGVWATELPHRAGNINDECPVLLGHEAARGGPAGGGCSTVEDLTKFAEALKAGKLVSREGVRLLTTPKPELSSPEYGFGFGIEEGGRIVGHSGGFPGINSQLDIYLGDDYTLAVMSNYGGGAQPIVEKARTLILAGRRQTASR